jgi:hypothetical protein
LSDGAGDCPHTIAGMISSTIAATSCSLFMFVPQKGWVF